MLLMFCLFLMHARVLIQCGIKFLSTFLFMAFMSGCTGTMNKTLSPPEDTKWVKVEIRNPSPYTKPFPLEILYISDICKRKLVSMRDGKHYEKSGYNLIKTPLNKHYDSDVWSAKVAINGGGKCNWMLSELNLGIKYIDVKHLGDNLVLGTSVGMTVAFGNNSTQYGLFELVSGNDMHLSPRYYPLIKENKRIIEFNSLSLFGKNNFIKKTMMALSGDMSVVFTPTLDETKIVYMIAPENSGVGDFYKFYYPNGDVVSDGSTHPDLKKSRSEI